jgi:hypothetical protein
MLLQVYVNPSSRPNTPSVVVKAPSTESIKSWNISVAETLIRKSEIEALEAEVLAEREEEEFDPFDTTKFEDPSEDKKEVPVAEESHADIEDPFDTSEFPDFEKEERLRREAEEEARKKAEVDLLTDDNELGSDLGDITIVPEKGPEPDPFDTGFAAKVLPNHGDPFDTSFVTGCPGKAEIQALEEEFLEKEDFDPRTAEGSSIPRKAVAPGTAGRARPKKGLATDLKVKVPLPVAAPEKPREDSTESKEEEEEDDPFDTSIVNKVIPVRKAKQRSDLSVEDEDFDPTHTFQKVQKDIEFDPFDTTIAGTVIPELAEKSEPAPPEPEQQQEEVAAETVVPEPPVVEQEPPKPEPKVLSIDGQQFKILPPARPRRSPAKRSTVADDDDDFDPRA